VEGESWAHPAAGAL